MIDLKILRATLDQLEYEKHIPRVKIIEAIEQALAAAYKRDFAKKGQIIRCHFNEETGDTEFYQVKIVTNTETVKPAVSEEDLALIEAGELEKTVYEEDDRRPRFDSEKHIDISDAQRIRTDVEVEQEMVFPLETEEDFGRIAAQTAKQVIIQRIREAEKFAILDEYQERQGEIVSGVVQKYDHGVAYVELDRLTAVLPKEEQIPGEFYKTGQRVKAYLYSVEESTRGVSVKISRSHPRFIESLFALESPEVSNGTVEVKSIAREPGARSKIAVVSYDGAIDAIGACVGQKGIRVTTVMEELGGEKIDIIPWAEDTEEFVANSLAPARVLDISIDEEAHVAHVEVADNQLSLAIGKGGQNVRLAAKLTGWKIDIKGVAGESSSPTQTMEEGEGFVKANDAESLKELVAKAQAKAQKEEAEGE